MFNGISSQKLVRRVYSIWQVQKVQGAKKSKIQEGFIFKHSNGSIQILKT